jgi:hypothetical protein
MALSTYDPLYVLVSFKGIPISGYADGTFIKAERNEAAYTQKVGASGEVCRARSRNMTGKVTLTLLASSPVNDLLSACYMLDEATNAGFGSFFIKELNGSTVCMAPVSYVEKLPSVEYAKEVGQREWVFLCDQLIENVGGLVGLAVD